MRPLLIVAALIVLTGCARHIQPDPAAKVVKPAGMVQIFDDKDATAYFSFNSLALYNHNPHLRQLYMITNYKQPGVISQKKKLAINSSRRIVALNCDRLESAIFDVVLFSQPFAEGKVIARRDTIGQWHAIPDNSLSGLTRRAACKIDPEKIRDISLKETRTPSFD
ncbi:surface-adhesin E family protein [Pantoea sp. MBD-2R]|uniref:surface-adhesin E family protein n=1 Tax=Pantoea sp. MBD-2R TaxID=3141540 RepID=UPI003182FBCD